MKKKGVLSMARRTTYELIDFLTTGNDLSISATDLHSQTKQIISSDNTVRYYKRKYGTRQYALLSGLDSPTLTDAYNEFCLDFRMWVNNRQHNIDKLYQSMFDYDYSPIENVDRYETETINIDNVTAYDKTNTISETDTTTHNTTDTTTFGKVNSNAKGGTESRKENGGIINEQKKAAFNSPFDYTPDVKNQETYDDLTNLTTYNTTDTDTESGTESLAKTGTEDFSKSETDTLSGTDRQDHDTDRELRVHGNIGVTSNVDLLEQEERYRLQSLAELLLDNFINDYTFYS